MISSITNLDVGRARKVKLRFKSTFKGSSVEWTMLKPITNFYSYKTNRKRAGQEQRSFSQYHIKKYSFWPKSKPIHWSRHLFTNLDELKFTIKENHKKQALRYWFDIQFGYVLRNIETDDRVQFYPSDNTCFNINDSPLVNSTIDTVLNQLDGDDILEKLKCSNSKWSIENIYEYVLLTTPIPEVSIGASVILPDFIKNSKSIVSF